MFLVIVRPTDAIFFQIVYDAVGASINWSSGPVWNFCR